MKYQKYHELRGFLPGMPRLLVYPILFFLLLLGGVPATAQTDINYSQLINNIGFINPSYQGRSMDFTADVLYGRQWEGLDDSPRSTGFNLHGGLKRYGFAAGLIGNFDKYIVSSKSLVAANLSAGVEVARESFLLFGIRIGADMVNYDKNKFNGADADIFYGESEQWFTVGTGVSFQRKGLLAGASAIFDIGSATGLYVNAEYNFPVGKIWNVKPLALYRYHSYWESYAEAGGMGGMAKWFQVGASYRTSGSVILMGQLNLLQCVSLNYSYHTHTGDVADLSKNTNEIGLSVNISKAIRGNRARATLLNGPE